MEWVSVISSTSKGPTVKRPESGTSMISTVSASPASNSYGATIAAVKAVA
jgi:hypothetical protein